MIGRRVTSLVKWILCKIILVISQRQAHFRQFSGVHAIFLYVILMVNMLSLIKSKRLRLFGYLVFTGNRDTYSTNIWQYLSPSKLIKKKSRVKTFDNSSLKRQQNSL